MVVVAALEFYFGNHSSLVIDLDADYIYFVCSLFTLPPRADGHIFVTSHHFEPDVFFKYMTGICRIIRDHDLSKAPIINHFNQCLVAVEIDERISGNYHLSHIAHSEMARARGESIRRRWLIE